MVLPLNKVISYNGKNDDKESLQNTVLLVSVLSCLPFLLFPHLQLSSLLLTFDVLLSCFKRDAQYVKNQILPRLHSDILSVGQFSFLGDVKRLKTKSHFFSFIHLISFMSAPI